VSTTVLALGYYENFPQNIHKFETFSSTFSRKQLQKNIIQLLHDVNCKELSFEEIAYPTIPEGTVIFEFGLAENGNFNYIDEEELKKALRLIAKDRLDVLDFFCAIRYYKGKAEKKTSLKFDYYLLRTIFGKGSLEVQVFHERGPRYISPQDLVDFLQCKLNENKTRKILKKNEPED
jgi:hypothetical protein